MNQTIKYYNDHARDWVDRVCINKSSMWQEELEKFNQLLPSGKVIEIGSGAGREAKILGGFGYDYLGVDASEGLLELAREKNPKLRFIEMDLYHLDFATNTFDGFVTIATLLHIPKQDIDQILQNIKNILKPKAYGLITMKAG